VEHVISVTMYPSVSPEGITKKQGREQEVQRWWVASESVGDLRRQWVALEDGRHVRVVSRLDVQAVHWGRDVLEVSDAPEMDRSCQRGWVGSRGVNGMQYSLHNSNSCCTLLVVLLLHKVSAPKFCVTVFSCQAIWITACFSIRSSNKRNDLLSSVVHGA
jgi:hypothetical protein